MNIIPTTLSVIFLYIFPMQLIPLRVVIAKDAGKFVHFPIKVKGQGQGQIQVFPEFLKLETSTRQIISIFSPKIGLSGANKIY